MMESLDICDVFNMSADFSDPKAVAEAIGSITSDTEFGHGLADHPQISGAMGFESGNGDDELVDIETVDDERFGEGSILLEEEVVVDDIVPLDADHTMFEEIETEIVTSPMPEDNDLAFAVSLREEAEIMVPEANEIEAEVNGIEAEDMSSLFAQFENQDKTGECGGEVSFPTQNITLGAYGGQCQAGHLHLNSLGSTGIVSLIATSKAPGPLLINNTTVGPPTPHVVSATPIRTAAKLVHIGPTAKDEVHTTTPVTRTPPVSLLAGNRKTNVAQVTGKSRPVQTLKIQIQSPGTVGNGVSPAVSLLTRNPKVFRIGAQTPNVSILSPQIANTNSPPIRLVQMNSKSTNLQQSITSNPVKQEINEQAVMRMEESQNRRVEELTSASAVSVQVDDCKTENLFESVESDAVVWMDCTEEIHTETVQTETTIENEIYMRPQAICDGEALHDDDNNHAERLGELMDVPVAQEEVVVGGGGGAAWSATVATDVVISEDPDDAPDHSYFDTTEDQSEETGLWHANVSDRIICKSSSRSSTRQSSRRSTPKGCYRRSPSPEPLFNKIPGYMSALSHDAGASGPSMDGTALTAASSILGSRFGRCAVVDQDPPLKTDTPSDTVDYSRLPGYCSNFSSCNAYTSETLNTTREPKGRQSRRNYRSHKDSSKHGSRKLKNCKLKNRGSSSESSSSERKSKVRKRQQSHKESPSVSSQFSSSDDSSSSSGSSHLSLSSMDRRKSRSRSRSSRTDRCRRRSRSYSPSSYATDSQDSDGSLRDRRQSRRRHHYSRSSSRSDFSRSRSKSYDRKWRRKRPRRYSHSRSRGRNSRSRSRSPHRKARRARREAHNQAMEERRVVYVGGISDTCAPSDLRKRFDVFGEIENVTVHFRVRGDNYGFITYLSPKDSQCAIEEGNRLPGRSYNLCYGGRRMFCKTDYADLDGCTAVKEEWALFEVDREDPADDFDALLQQTLKKIKS